VTRTWCKDVVERCCWRGCVDVVTMVGGCEVSVTTQLGRCDVVLTKR